MILTTSITVPIRTLPTSPIRQELKIGKGTLVKVTLDVPPGANGEVYFRLLHMENSIVPDKIDEWIPLTGNLYTFTLNFADWKGVYKLLIESCAPQSRYSHTYDIHLEIDELGTTAELMNQILRMGSNGQT